MNIREDIHPAFQLRRYAWSSKLPLSILSDFEEFAVYDCRVKPQKTDKASVARIFYMRYDEYAERWDEIVSIFSREAILKGSFDKYVESTKSKRGTADVDDAFLKEIETWRDILAKNIALRNPSLSQRELNFAVQITIDRIIFLRICEDRGIEDYGRLMALQNGGGIYTRLLDLYRKADARYNSGLFHFEQEKGRPETRDTLTPKLSIDDKVLKDIFKGLYYPDSPYEFSVLPSDILGQVYEQFLGKVIRLTSGHRAVVEEKPEVKKAGGVYYTPTYIVDYIVKNTVGKLVEGKTPNQVSKLKIVDPACGSGSFLIGAYQYLIDWHRDYYENDRSGKHAKHIYQSRSGEWRLTTSEKKRILLNNIYGVDIDSQAVEVTKLSLLLKVLEGETEESINAQMRLFQERALPDLSNNIKCGNSLIGPDFYDNQQTSLFDEEEAYRINVFDWQAEFHEIFANGGFDAVIGNPPYVRQESLGEFKEYFKSKYAVYQGAADLYSYFIEKGISLLNSNGIFAYIVANKWMRANYGEPLRRWLKQKRIHEIVDFGDLPVFKRATTYPCILTASNNKPGKQFNATQIKNLDFNDLGSYVSKNSYPVNQETLSDKGWSLTNEKARLLLEKLKATGTPLGDYVNKQIYRGVLTGLNEAFVIDTKTRAKLIAEDPGSEELIKPFLAGRDIKRYKQPKSDKYLIFMPKGWTRAKSNNTNEPWSWLESNYPAIANHLSPFKKAGEKRCDKGEYWWELRACDYYDQFEKPKIICPAIVKTASYSLDREGYYSNDKTTIIVSDNLYLLGVLSSKLIDFYMHSISSTKRGGYFEYKPMYICQLPIYNIHTSEHKTARNEIASLVKQAINLQSQLTVSNTSHEQSVLQRQIDATDHQINQLVYQLYNLTPEEIKIIEEATL